MANAAILPGATLPAALSLHFRVLLPEQRLDMTRLLVSSLVWVLVCLASPAAFAQEASQQDPPAHISFVDGAAVLERDGQSDSNIQSMPLLAGDRVRTQGARVEVLFADGSALHLDANTVVDFQSDDVVRL